MYLGKREKGRVKWLRRNKRLFLCLRLDCHHQERNQSLFSFLSLTQQGERKKEISKQNGHGSWTRKFSIQFTTSQQITVYLQPALCKIRIEEARKTPETGGKPYGRDRHLV